MEDALAREYTAEEKEEFLQHFINSSDQFDAFPSGNGSDEGGKDVLSDSYGFPFEPEGIYNSAPIEFEEIATALWIMLSNINYAAVRYNRLSPCYTTLMQRLEKDIKQMGSYCITKAVLEQSGQKFPALDIISVKELYQMVSVHFRKCCMAYNDLQKSGKGQDMNLIGWIFRWAFLAQRLKATQDKINDIRMGKIKIESLLAKETVYKGEPRSQHDHSPYMVSPEVKASSLPILKSYTGEVKTRKREEEKRERAAQRDSERAQKRLEKTAEKLPAEFRDPIIRPYPLPKIPGINLNIKELKQLLMDEAKRRGDMAQAGIIARENEKQLIDRFLKFQELDRPPRPSGPEETPRSGPSAETRKKLREKRKKRK